jgi:hypothetical protein
MPQGEEGGEIHSLASRAEEDAAKVGTEPQFSGEAYQ